MTDVLTLTLTLTRRRATALLLASPLATGIVAPAMAAPSLEAQMRAALAEADMPLPDMVLELVRFSEETSQGQTRLTAVVRMIWPPGVRQRKFIAQDRVPDLALSALIAETVTEFRAAARG